MSGNKEASSNSEFLKEKAAVTLDCTGMLCPHPILEIAKKMRQLEPGQVLELLATDPNTKRDIPTWCQKTSNPLIKVEEKEKTIVFYVKKGSGRI